MYGFSSLANKRLVRLCSVRLLSDNNQSTKKLLELIADMPKANSSRIAEAQRQRQNISKKSDKYAPSTVYLQVIGSGARGAPNTLYLFTDQKRYLFNCGECTQRLAHEHKVKLSRLDHIFITNKTWRNIGGLPGLSLTLQDVGVPNITLHGPEGLDELYNATKRFVVMKDMNVTMAKCTPSEDFEDNALTIKYVLLGPHDNFLFEKPAAKKAKLENIDKEFEEFIHDETDYYNKSFMRSSDSFNRKEKNAKPKSKDKETDKTDKLLSKTERALHILDKRSDCSVAYICTLKKRFGTLDLAKCVEFGVKPGPMLGQLKSGQDVLLPDGTLVLSKDVKTPDDPGPVFIVLEVPDITYLKESEFELHFDTPNNPPENIPALIVHLSPPHVFNHETYRTFMSKFGASCRHLVLNSQNSCLGSEAVHRTQHKLNLLDSEIFPLLKDASVPAVWNSRPSPATDSPARRGLEDLKNKIAVAQFQNIINMEGSKGDGQTSKEEGDKLEVVTPRTLTAFQLRPKRQVDRSAEPKLHIQEYIQETMDVDGFVGSLEQFRRLVENMRYARVDSQREYPKVVFLGTGSCIPSKTRNTSAIAVQISEHQSMLMDCGEGTFGQLVRFFGPKKVNSFLRTLKAIYVSHLHADHHIGLIGVLQARREAFEQAGAQYEPLYLLAPGQIITWLSIYDQQFERIKADFTLVPNQNLLIHSPSSTSSIPSPVEVSPAMLACLGVQDIRTCLVSHCPNAFGVCLDIDGHNKLTYSGDTIPCDALVQLGKGSTLLIHEATMEDELADEARIKMHSTTSQAIEVGKQMQARYTLLTHFSQRYARLPRLNATILHDNHSVGIAFDNMQISMSDLELLPHMYAPLQLMFAEHCVEMEIKAKHRARQKQRRTSSPSMPNSAEHNKFRWISPGCRTVTSVAIPHANYRETNASRLRQEIKGMAITGIVRKGQRSGSASPTHKRSPTASPTRLHTGDGSPKKRDSEKNLDVTCNSRTVSETSSSSRDTQDKLRTGIASSGYVVDTRSKTLNSLPSNTASTDKVTHLHKFQSEPHKEKKESPSSQPASKLSVAPTVNKGYGKPLVTPVNKKLSIRRDYNLTNEPRVRETTHTRHVTPTKSPSVPRPISPKPTSKLSHQAAHKPPFNTSPKISGEFAKAPLPQPHYKVDMMTSVLVHLIMWRVAHIASYLYSTAWPCAMAITALAIVFWTAIKDAPSANSSNVTIPSEKKSPVSAKCRPVAKPRPASANASRIEKNKENVKKNENRPITARNLSSSVNKVSEPTKPDAKAHVSGHYVSKVSTLRSSLTRIPTKIYSENNLKQRNISTERLKQQFCRDTPIYAAGRPNSVIHSNKSFKPQLEDIQSSYLLLNKTQHELENKLKSKPESRVDEVPFVPKKFDDNERKFQLYRIKQKFKSRRFFHDSRYEKIEGLNWISWKD